MRKKHLFIRLLEVCLFLIVFSTVCPAQNYPESNLIVSDPAAKEQGLCRLKNTDIRAGICGFISRFTFTQTFQNPLTANKTRSNNLENQKNAETFFEARPNIFSPNNGIKLFIGNAEIITIENTVFSRLSVNSRSGNQPNGNDGLISIVSRSSDSNNISVDYLGANLGLGADDTSFSRNAGALPTQTASGGTNAILDLNAISEVTIRSYGKAGEHRVSGSQIDFVSRSGGNEFHGSLFENFGNEAVNANDFFADVEGFDRAPSRSNQFGGALGGYIKQNRAWFFASYEGLRLRQSSFGISEVPNLISRQTAATEIRPLLNAFPVPNGRETVNNLAEFSSVFTNPAVTDIFGLRIDIQPAYNLRIGGRLNLADSEASIRGARGFSLNTNRSNKFNTKSLSVWSTYLISSVLVFSGNVNFSQNDLAQEFSTDDFGGAAHFGTNSLLPTDFLKYDLAGKNSALANGQNASSVKQFQTNAAFNWIAGNHNFIFGGSFRRLALEIAPNVFERSILFSGVDLDGTAARINEMTRTPRQIPLIRNFSLFAQDNWQIFNKLYINLGFRWDADFAPDVVAPDAILNNNSSPQMPDNLKNFSPRVSFAYDLFESGKTILRGGIGLYYDFGNSASSEIFANSYPFARGNFARNTPFTNIPATPLKPLLAFQNDLQTPRTWHVYGELQQNIIYNHHFTATYTGSFGRRLYLTRTLFNTSPEFNFLRLTDNSGESNYHAAQILFERRFYKGFAYFARYTFAKSIDNFSTDLLRENNFISPDLRQDRGFSDFDVRHLFSVYGVYAIPTPFSSKYLNYLTKNWSISASANARTAFPINVTYTRVNDLGMEFLRPDPVENPNFYLNESGIRTINPNAFTIPTEDRQGFLGRNTLRGFSLFQLDTSLFRRVRLGNNVSLNLGINTFNLLNNVNFADMSGNLGTRFSPTNFLTNSFFGQPTSTFGSGTFTPIQLYGGARTIQFSAKLAF